ncbi:MAG: efflux RND transporter periplasmic adaptor subunit [Persicimonas sp.]
MRRLTKVVGGLVLVAVAAGSIWYFGGLSTDEGATTGEPATEQVVRREFSATVRATGSVEPMVGAEVEVGARVSGKVDRLDVGVGDRVSEGDLLAVLESGDLQARVDRRRAALDRARTELAAVKSTGPRRVARAEAELERWQADQEFARKDSKRQQDLAQKDFTPMRALDSADKQVAMIGARTEEARVNLANVKTQYQHDLEASRARVREAEAALADARTQLSYASIHAPIDGTVSSVSTEEGETVAAGLQSPTFVTILDLDRLRVDAFVDEVDIAKIEAGQEVQFSVDAHPTHEFDGEVRTIYPKALTEDDVVYYRVVIDISESATSRLRPGMTADVTVFRERRTDVLAIPARAIERDEGRDIVYTQSGQRTERHRIKVGWRDGQWVEVVDGLEEGQTVLLDPPDPSESTEGGDKP